MHFRDPGRRSSFVLATLFGLLCGNSAASAQGSLAERPAYARSSDALVYHGKILRPDGSPVEGNVTLDVQIYSPEPSKCLLWAESQTVTAVKGGFSAEIGYTTTRRIGPNGGAAPSFREVFLNNPGLTIASAQCAQGTSYVPSATDDRIMKVNFVDGGTTITMEEIPIKSVPFAKQAQEIAGYGINNLFKIAGSGSPTVVFQPTEVDALKSFSGSSLASQAPSAAGSGNQFLGMNAAGDGMEYKSITAGSNVTINHTAGGIQISASGGGGGGGGTVESVTVGGAPLSVGGSTASPVISIAQAGSGQAGFLSAADWALFNNKQPAGSYLTGITGAMVNAALGYTPISSTSSSQVISALGFTPVNQNLSDGQVFVGNGSNVAAGRLLRITDIRSTFGAGTDFFLAASGACSAGQSLGYNSVNDKLECAAYSLTSAQVTGALGFTPQAAGSYLTGITGADVNTALGYTPVNRAGDAMTGALSIGTTTPSTIPALLLANSDNSTNWDTPFKIERNGLNVLSIRNQHSAGSILYTDIASGTGNFFRLYGNSTYTDGVGRIDLNASQIFLNGQVLPQGEVLLTRTGDASSIGSQRDSNPLAFQSSLWNGSTSEFRHAYIKQVASTSEGLKSRMGFFLHQEAANWSPVERFSISSSGNVGIGTTSPVVPLDLVNGTIMSGSHYFGTSYSGGIRMRMDVTEGLTLGSTYKTGWTSTTLAGTNANHDTALSRNSAGVVEINNGTAGQYRDLQLRSINPSIGNVGIGTTSPSERLEVAGNIKGTQLCIGADCRSAWPSGASGSVTEVSVGGAPLSVTNGTTTPQISIAQANSTTPGFLSSADWVTFNDKLAAITGASLASANFWLGNGSNQATAVTMSGDVTMTNTGATTVGKINNTNVSGVGLANNNLLQNNSGSTISGNSVLVSNGTGTGVTALSTPMNSVLMSNGSSVPTWGALSSDLFTQYAALGGRAGGQTLNGGTAAGDDLILDSTVNATKGDVILNPTSGNVGIGTSSPSVKLSIAGGIDLSTQLTLRGGGLTAANFGRVYHDNANMTLSTSGGTGHIILSPVGGVGIGTTSPQDSLHIRRSSGTTSLQLDRQEGAFAYLNLTTNGSRRWHLGVSNASETGSSVGSDFYINRANDSGAFVDTPFFIARNTGNVGIGTVAPSNKLEVAGGIRSTAMTITNENNWNIIATELYSSTHHSAFRHAKYRGTSAAPTAIQDGDLLGYFDAYGYNGTGTEWAGGMGIIARSNWASTRLSDLNFSVAGAGEVMRITSSGRMGIRTANPSTYLHVNGPANDWQAYFGSAGIWSGNSGAWNRVVFGSWDGVSDVTLNVNGVDRLVVKNSNGNIGIGTNNPTYTFHVVGNAGLSTGTTWTNASDARLKDIHGPYQHGLAEVLQLNPVVYNYKKKNALELPSDFEKTGFIAQEVQQVIPEAVSERKDGYLELNVDPIHWAVVNSIKEFYRKWLGDSQSKDKKIKNLEAKLDSLSQQNSALKSYICEKDPHASFCKPNGY